MTRQFSLCALFVLALAACRPGDQSPVTRRPGPGPGDSLAKLKRRLLVDPDPVTIAQAITCEHGRLIRLYGPYKADSISRRVRDTIYTWRDQAARRRVDAKLANHVFYTDCGYPLGSEVQESTKSR